MTVSNNSTGFTLYKKVYGKCTHHRCIYTVLTCRVSTTLHMSEDRCTCLNTCSCFNTSCHSLRMTNTLCIYDDMVFLSCFTACNNVIDQLLLIIVIFLRDQDVLRSIGDTAPHSKISCITSHNFDNTASFVRCGSITNFIDCLHCCIYCCIKSDCILCAGNVQVNCSRNTDCIDSKICQLLCTCKRTVSTDNYQSVDSMFLADFCTTLLSFRCTEFCTSCCIKNCTTAFDRI